MPAKFKKLQKFRRKLHAHPEVSGKEFKTARRIVKFLKACKPTQLETGVGGNGIIAIWDSGNTGKSLVFRAELDALPISEINESDYASKNKGVSHKCGHDGHSTILCGMAEYLGHHLPEKGKIVLIFQAAEEDGTGAALMMNDKRFQELTPDYIFALHNLPGYPLGEVVVKDLNFTASVNSMIIELNGKTAHAAEPENGVNPALAIAEILQVCQALQNNELEKTEMVVITPVHIKMGSPAYGVSAGSAEIHLTIRSWNDEFLRELEKKIETLATQVASEHQLSLNIRYTETFYANINDPEPTSYVRLVAASEGFSITERQFPFKWGEDFGVFGTHFKACMFGLGAGENTPALHNPDYDFPDELIKDGLKIFKGLIKYISEEIPA